MKTYELKHQNGYVLGRAVKKADGWYFYPNVSGRSPSRRGHLTADDCLPTWARRFFNKGGSFLPPPNAEAK